MDFLEAAPAEAPTYAVVCYRDHRDRIPAPEALTWEQLTQALALSEETSCGESCPGSKCPLKYTSAWSPVRMREPQNDSEVVIRANDNVQAVTLAVFDLDHISEEQLASAAQALDGYRYIAHSTHSHRPPERQSLRVVVALSRPVLAAEWRPFLTRAVAHLGIPADRACKDLSRLYFTPTRPAGSVGLFETGEGVPLDVDEILKGGTHGSAGAASRVLDRPRDDRGDRGNAHGTLDPILVSDQVVDLGALRKRLVDLRGKYIRAKDERAAIVSALLDGEAVAAPGGRDATLHTLGSILATKLPGHTPWDAVAELLRPSIMAMDTEPEGPEHWLKMCRYSYDRAMDRRLENDARRDAANERLRQQLLNLNRRMDGGVLGALNGSHGAGGGTHGGRDPASPERGSGSAEAGSGAVGADGGMEAGSEPAADDEGEPSGEGLAEWTQLLLYNKITKAEEVPSLKSCTYNASVILEHHESWKGVLRFNDVTKQIDTFGGPLSWEEMHPSVMPLHVANWLQATADLSINEMQARSVILGVARKNAYDPLRDSLLGLVWDGVPRIDNFLLDYCGAVTVDESGIDITEHVKRISRKWLLQAIARALNPGVQADYVLVLEGVQGARKTSSLRVMGGPFFTDSPIVIGNKDSQMMAGYSWLIELSELVALRASETAAQKAFFTAREDLYRPPYAAALEKAKRRCVFIGTTNEDVYLTDMTGNRRYWPVRVTTIDRAGLARDRDLIWAEAVAVYLSAASCETCKADEDGACDLHRPWLRGAEAEEAERQANDRVDFSNPALTAIGNWWYGRAPETRPKFVTCGQVADEALKITPDKYADRMGKGLEMSIGRTLLSLGFTRTRPRIHGVRTWGYAASSALLTGSRQSAGRILAMVPKEGMS